jgi:hypothetical protein
MTRAPFDVTELDHRLHVAPVGFLTGDVVVRRVAGRLEAEQVQHYDRPVRGAGEERLDLLGVRVEGDGRPSRGSLTLIGRAARRYQLRLRRRARRMVYPSA